MRVLLVGSASGRARLRTQLASASIDVAAEFASTAAARTSDVEHDAIVVAPDGPFDESRFDDGDDVETGVVEPLTQREIQVLALLAEGLPNKAIADRLKISDQTVKFHVSSISAKLGAANRTDAVRRGVRLGLITL
jgi:two-component system, NarL family, response regulator YdfI